MPWPLYHQENSPCTHCIGSWVDSRASLDNLGEGKRERERGRNKKNSVVLPIA